MKDYDPKVDGLYTIEEMKAKAQNKGMLIKMNDDDQTFEVVGTSWWAKCSSVDTPEKMLACIYHLTTKAWISTEHIHEFMTKLAARNHLEIESYDAME